MVTVVNVCPLELSSANIFLLCELFSLVFTLDSSVQASGLDRQETGSARGSARVCGQEAL